MKIKKGHWVSCDAWTWKLKGCHSTAYQIAKITKDEIFVWFGDRQWNYDKGMNFFRVYRNDKKYKFDK